MVALGGAGLADEERGAAKPRGRGRGRRKKKKMQFKYLFTIKIIKKP